MCETLKKTAIVLTGHPRQQKFWSPTLLCLEPYPGTVVLAYDDIDAEPIVEHVAPVIARDRIVVTGRPAGQLGHGPGELMCMQIGFDKAAELGAEYILKLACDDPPWRWRNLPVLTADSEGVPHDCIHTGTRIIFGRADVLCRAMHAGDLRDRKGSAESYFAWALGTIGARRKIITDANYWTELLGTIHIQGEYALNCGRNVGWAWRIGELWPRKD